MRLPIKKPFVTFVPFVPFVAKASSCSAKLR
jgi:hypothetical protein